MSKNQNKSAWIGAGGAIIGAIITGIFVLVGILVKNHLDSQKQDSDDTTPATPTALATPTTPTTRDTQYIIDYIEVKRKFRVRLDRAIGTLGKDTHKVIYENGRFVSRGTHSKTKKYYCLVPGYDNAILGENQITLWNQPFTFDENRNLYYKESIIGKLELNDNFSTDWKSTCHQRKDF